MSRRMSHCSAYCADSRRTGVILVGVLACLVVVTSLCGSLLHTVLRDRHQVRVQQQLMQTELLCEAGVMRAATQLKNSPQYAGETWTPDLESAGWPYAQVDIEVDIVDESRELTVRIVARLGRSSDEFDTLQRSHTFALTTSPVSETEQ